METNRVTKGEVFEKEVKMEVDPDFYKVARDTSMFSVIVSTLLISFSICILFMSDVCNNSSIVLLFFGICSTLLESLPLWSKYCCNLEEFESTIKSKNGSLAKGCFYLTSSIIFMVSYKFDKGNCWTGFIFGFAFILISLGWFYTSTKIKTRPISSELTEKLREPDVPTPRLSLSGIKVDTNNEVV